MYERAGISSAVDMMSWSCYAVLTGEGESWARYTLMYVKDDNRSSVELYQRR
jgi:hypothetical protein